MTTALAPGGAWRAEQDLLTEPVRADRAELEAILHDDFVEIGASGRRWGRPDTIEQLVGAPSLEAYQVELVALRELADQLVMVEYEMTTAERGLVRRMSLWTNESGRWQILWHQGTLC
ncbi:MAG: nuclear transport factor 2 family protein [Ilumatobacter sp.]|uniref:nuclear transport factor 2 family protein n=1 Tax=Ilumatobacter sp. TaxID=1967498 RepID=UPI00262A6C09|nr:nuclear transport factor 2 family protein [Ilumatobacter sp.]MDJ0771766.1 nuclear transport factor 2 family protein [Ilumatobacter sp.]